jgi:glycosyltransferase involved in cell wall biosynthesis
MSQPETFLPQGAQVPDGKTGPFWTVAFPTYNVDEALFEKTMRSVLDQDPGPERMEIMVSDNCSTDGVAERVARRLAPDRIGFYRNASNLGLAGNWNACISRARGEWVHILHADDLVLPGFYERLERGAQAAPEVGVLFCQHAFIDENDRWTSISSLERRDPGILENWLEILSRSQQVQCPAIAVRRDVYERVGRFRDDLFFVLDWEMWIRITAAGIPWWFEPRVLACYRIHEGSETSRLNRAGRDVNDLLRGVAIVQEQLPPPLRARAGERLRKYAGMKTLLSTQRAIGEGSPRQALQHLHQAHRLDPSLSLSTRLVYYRRIIKAALVGGWARVARAQIEPSSTDGAEPTR